MQPAPEPAAASTPDSETDPASGNGVDTPASGTAATPAVLPREIGGREGPEPVRYGDWEKNGRCIDF